MEGLSAAASGIAVISAAIQLVESFKKLCNFCKSIKEAPEDIRAISVDLELLSSVLVQIAYETQHVEPDATLIAALNGCCVKVKTLTTLLNEIEPGFASPSSRVHKWTAFKAILKHGELMRFQESLERLKSTLLLVQQNQYSRLSRNRQNSLERTLATLSHKVSSFSVQQHLEIAGSTPTIALDSFRAEGRDTTGFCAGTIDLAQSDHPNSDGTWIVPRKNATLKRALGGTKSVIETLLGTIRATSTTILKTSRQTGDLTLNGEQDQYEHKTSFTIYPAPWLIRLGIKCGLHLGFLSSSTQGWKNTLKTFCPVPDDALIFEFCRQGNVPAVRTLLSRGHASVRDTDSWGHTPLHFAAQNYHPELCEILKSAGADITTLTYDAQTPMMFAAGRAKYITDPMLSETVDTFRILIDSMDFFEDHGDGWIVLEGLCLSTWGARGSRKAKGDLLLWMLQLSSFELKTNIIEERYANMLYWTLRPGPKLAEASDLLLNLGGDDVINIARHDKDGYTLPHERLLSSMDEDEVTEVLARGADLHRLGIDTYYTPYEESPTSLAMYSSRTFTYWLNALARVDVDLESFIDQELEQNLEVHPGWEKETLGALFAHGDRPDLHVPYTRTCSDCAVESIRVFVQPYWRHLLGNIKQREYHEDPAPPGPEVAEEENPDRGNARESVSSNSSDPTYEPETTRNVPLVNLKEESESESESKSEEDSSKQRTKTPIRSVCMYGRHELVCMDCWLYYEETGTRRMTHAWEGVWQDVGTDEDLFERRDSLFKDDSSECEYSPFLIHS